MNVGERPHLQPPHASPVGSGPASTLNMTMKEIKQIISDLKRENFNLKLRIFFCEDSLQRRSDGPAGEDDVRRTNIDLQVEVETLKEHVKKLQKALFEAQEQTQHETPESNRRIAKLEKDLLERYNKETEEQDLSVAMELRIKDLETGNLKLEAKLQEKYKVILALEKELENEKVKCDAKLSELQYALAETRECLSEKDFLLSEKEVEMEVHEDTIKSLTCRLRQHKCVCIENTGDWPVVELQEQLKDIDEALDRKGAKSPLVTQEKNSDFGALGTSVQQIEIQIRPSSCDWVISAFQETIDRKENGERQVTSSSLRAEAEMPGNQVEEQNIRPQEIRHFRSQERGRLQSDSLVAQDSEIAPTEDKNNSGLQHLEPRINKSEETAPVLADKHNHCRGCTSVRDRIGTNTKKVKALERRVKEMQGQVEESNRKLEVLEKMLQSINATVSDQTTQRLEQIFSDAKVHNMSAAERQHSGPFDEGYGSGTDQNRSSVPLDTVRDQERDYRRLKIRLSASDRLRKDLAEKAFEVETLQNERKHLLCEKSTLAEGQRHAHHDLMSLEHALHSARKEIESLMVQMKPMEKLHLKEMVHMSVVPQDSKQTVLPVNTSRTDCGSRTQKDSLSSPLSCRIKHKIKEWPVHQTMHGKTHHTRIEPLDCVSRRPRVININYLEHGKDSSSLRNLSELSNAETLKLRTNSLHRSGLNANKYGSAAASSSHCSSRWSTNPYMSPSLAHDDIGLQRIVAEVKVLTYGISRVLSKAHDGRSPGYSQSSDPYSENVKLNKIIKTLKMEKSNNKRILFEALKRLQRVNQRKLERLCD